MKYQDLKAGIRSHLEDAAEDFFMVGYFLRQISENALFTEDGESTWHSRNLVKLFIHGNHTFYTETEAKAN